MRRSLILTAVLAALLCGPPADAAQIAQVTGNMDDASAALDGSVETAAALRKSPADGLFEFIIYLAGEDDPDFVHVTVFPAPEDVELETSADLVNWEKRSLVVLKEEGSGIQGIKLDVSDDGPAQYLRVKMSAPGVEEMKLYEVAAGFKQQGRNSISGLEIEYPSENSVVIKYMTALPAQTHVSYGAGEPVMKNVYIDRFKTVEHRAELKDLLAGAVYFYQVKLSDADEGAEVRSFKTTGEALPRILTVNMPPPGPTGGTLLLEANKPVEWKVVWGEYGGGVPLDALESVAGAVAERSEGALREYGVDFAGLKPKTRYFFKVYAADGSGGRAESDLHGFDTAPLNLALGAPATGTFTFEMADKYIRRTDAPMGRVTDGDENYFTGFAKAEKTAYGEQWIEVDLGADREADTLIVVWSDLAVPQSYSVSVRADGGENEKLLEVENDEYPGWVKVERRRSLPGGDPLMDVTLLGKGKFRYVRIDIPKGAGIRSQFGWKNAILAELKVLAP